MFHLLATRPRSLSEGLSPRILYQKLKLLGIFFSDKHGNIILTSTAKIDAYRSVTPITLEKHDNPGWSNLFTISTGWPFKSLLKSLLFHGGNHKPLPNFPPQVVDSHTTGVAHVRCGWGNQITMSGDYWSMTNDYYWLLWSLVKKKKKTSYSSRVSSNSDRYPLFRSELYRSRNDITKDKRFENFQPAQYQQSLTSPFFSPWWSNFSKICRDVQDNSSQNWLEGTIFLNNVSFNQSVQRCCSSFHCFHICFHSHCILIVWESPCYPYFIPVLPLVPSYSW